MQEMESDIMKSTKNYLNDLENKLCSKIVTNWEQDDRFESLQEMQKYNCGISDAINLVREMLNSEDFKNTVAKHLEGK